MLTRFGSRALSALGYDSNDESATENETKFDDSKVISGDWVFVREKRPRRSCTKRNSSQTEEWFTVTRKRNKIKPGLESVSFEYDTMDDLPQKHNAQETVSHDENHNNSGTSTVVTRNQRKLMLAAEENKAMLERETKPKQLQNTSDSRNQTKQQNKVATQAHGKKRGRKRHIMATTYSGKSGRRGR